ncbi:hypothetical protein [Agromyces subbeticus]|uniref:hypothetical protein n=1 Tax=Agromyces subbeticus TaxID=293890 RepID=UPI0012EB096D|nr:hypothetical protein [Agromyces subbeticus]
MRSSTSGHANESEPVPEALPYSAPEGWLPDSQYFPTSVIWVVGGVAIAVGIGSALLTLAGSLVWGIELSGCWH